MRLSKLAVLGLGLVIGLPAAPEKPEKPWVATYEADNLEVEATLLDRESLKQQVGSDFDGTIIGVAIKLTPLLTEKDELLVMLDNFQMFSAKDGQRAAPFYPSQLAGKGALVSSRRYSGGAMVQSGPGQVIGGMPGTGTRPVMLGNPGTTMVGGDKSTEGVSKVDETLAADPLLDTLKAKVLVDGKYSKPVSGLLLFGIEGKHKPKDLEIFYRGPAGKFTLKFKP
jgi:hypothetical protein